MRSILAECSFLLIAAILKLWGRRWISTAQSRALTTLVMRATIWLLVPPRERSPDGQP